MAHPAIPRPIVRAAIAALDEFGATSAREASILLGYWCRRDQLGQADIVDILAAYGDATVYTTGGDL